MQKQREQIIELASTILVNNLTPTETGNDRINDMMSYKIKDIIEKSVKTSIQFFNEIDKQLEQLEQ